MLREHSDWRHRKPNLVAINNISADIIVSPESRKNIHLGIIWRGEMGNREPSLKAPLLSGALRRYLAMAQEKAKAEQHDKK